jgi:hypothetical protein
MSQCDDEIPVGEDVRGDTAQEFPFSPPVCHAVGVLRFMISGTGRDARLKEAFIAQQSKTWRRKRAKEGYGKVSFILIAQETTKSGYELRPGRFMVGQ